MTLIFQLLGEEDGNDIVAGIYQHFTGTAITQPVLLLPLTNHSLVLSDYVKAAWLCCFLQCVL